MVQKRSVKGQLIQILTQDEFTRIRKRRILRKNLSKYQKLFTLDGRVVWKKKACPPTRRQAARSSPTQKKKAKRLPYSLRVGVRQDGRRFAQFQFSLRRKHLSYDVREFIMTKCAAMYAKVMNEYEAYIAQRIAIHMVPEQYKTPSKIALSRLNTQPKIRGRFSSTGTQYKLNEDYVVSIGTMFYRRNPKNIVPMFEDLANKIWAFFQFDSESGYDMREEGVEYKMVVFDVIFQENIAQELVQ